MTRPPEIVRYVRYLVRYPVRYRNRAGTPFVRAVRYRSLQGRAGARSGAATAAPRMCVSACARRQIPHSPHIPHKPNNGAGCSLCDLLCGMPWRASDTSQSRARPSTSPFCSEEREGEGRLNTCLGEKAAQSSPHQNAAESAAAVEGAPVPAESPGAALARSQEAQEPGEADGAPGSHAPGHPRAQADLRAALKASAFLVVSEQVSAEGRAQPPEPSAAQAGRREAPARRSAPDRGTRAVVLSGPVSTAELGRRGTAKKRANHHRRGWVRMPSGLDTSSGLEKQLDCGGLAPARGARRLPKWCTSR
jgi:hypothetical protein